MGTLDSTPIIPASRAYWTTAELAERFGVDVDAIYELASTGGDVERRRQQQNVRALMSAHGRVRTEKRPIFLS